MGLDMYLDKELFLSEFDKDKELVDKILGILNVKDESGNYKHLSVKIPAIYWRKSNQIHKWFVENVQDGVDDCQKFPVEIEKLQELLQQCKTALKKKDASIIPPQGGFFFGSTEIDQYYWDDIKETVKEIEREISFYQEEKECGRFWEYSYQASW